MLLELEFNAEIFKEGDVYVGFCPELNVSSFGDDIEDAKRSLQEAVIVFLEECEEMGSLEDVLEEAGFHKIQSLWLSRKPLMEERLTVSL